MLPCLSLLLLLPACSPDQGFATREVSRDDYGAQWPLTVEEGVLACEPGDVATVTVSGRSYALKALSGGDDVPADFRRIWAHVPQSGSRSDLSPLVEDAEALCD